MSYFWTKCWWGQMHCGPPYQNFEWAMADLAHPASPPCILVYDWKIFLRLLSLTGRPMCSFPSDCSDYCVLSFIITCNFMMVTLAEETGWKVYKVSAMAERPCDACFNLIRKMAKNLLHLWATWATSIDGWYCHHWQPDIAAIIYCCAVSYWCIFFNKLSLFLVGWICR